MTARKKKRAKAKPAESFVILLDDPDDPVDTASQEDEANIVRLRRDCTIEEIEGIQQRLLTAWDGHDRMIVDLGAVKGVDSAFLQLLVSLQLEAEARQGKVSLRNQSESFMQSAATLGLTEQFDER